MKRLPVLIALAILIMTAGTASAFLNNYNYISSADVKRNLAANTPMTLIDIQVDKEFNQHHIRGAVATYAYPVKSEEDRAKLATAIAELKNNETLAVIVCPRGGGGAQRAYDHLLESGIPKSRLAILTKGQAAWPYPELLAAE